MNNPWMQTRSAVRFDLIQPDASMVRFFDISSALYRLSRFNGHTDRPWTVMQHSMLVERLMPDEAPAILRLVALLHDAHEAYTGDISTPVQYALAMLGGPIARLGLKGMQANIQTAIHAAFGFHGFPGDLPPRWREEIKRADLFALAMEKNQFLPADVDNADWPVDLSAPAPFDISERSFTPVRLRFAHRCRELMAGAGLTPMRSLGDILSL